jgi:flagellin-like hook-associated protein FlgL
VLASHYFASANIGSIPSGSIQVDRNGDVRFNWGTTALIPTDTTRINATGASTVDYPNPPYRVLYSTAPNGNSYYAPVPSTATGALNSGLRTSPSATPITFYPARVAQSGTLEIRISNPTGSTVLPGTATATIDFSNPLFSPSSPPDSPAALQAMVDYINVQLNAPANRPNPPLAFRDASYVTLLNSQSTIQGKTLNYTDYPVGFAYIDSGGRLAIATAERNFQINVEEEQSDYPIFGIQRTSSSGSPSPATLTITGSPTGTMSQTISLESGKYTTADEFVKAHTTPVNLFAPNYSVKAVDNRLVITSTATGAAVNVSNMSVTPFAFSHLLGEFGLVNVSTPERFRPDSSPIRESRIGYSGTWGGGFAIRGIDWTPYDEQLPLEVIGVELKPKALWIQGRDRNGEDQGLYIFLPHLSASSMRLGDYKAPDYEISEKFKEELERLTGKPNFGNFTGIPTYEDENNNEDIKCGLNVLTRENANSAIDTVSSALTIVSKERARFGAATNALEHMKSAVTATHENITSAESRIRDTDMAMAMSEFVKNNIILQAAQAMLAQANQAPQGILQLLR